MQEEVKKDYMKRFANLMKRARREKKWSQTVLAKKVGLTQLTISKYENCEHQALLQNAATIAEVLEFDLNSIFDENVTTTVLRKRKYTREQLRRKSDRKVKYERFKQSLISFLDQRL